MAKKLNRAYGVEVPLVEVPHLPVKKSRAPTSSDKNFAVGDMWVYKIDASNYSLYEFLGLDSSQNAVWALSSSVLSGSATLVAGTVTVSTAGVTANSLILLTRKSVGSTGANDLGILSVGTITAGTSFVINSWTVTDATTLQADDVSVVGWKIIN